MEPTAPAPARLIVYACPVGALADQVMAFYTLSRERCGPNSAHAYPPHITLTGFFHDDLAALPRYTAALADARVAALASKPATPVLITALATEAEFHALLIDSPWLEALSADFKARAASPTRRDDLRLKRDLHLSLAYGFRPEHAPELGRLARAMVDPAASVGWELRLYERMPDGSWTVHGVWAL